MRGCTCEGVHLVETAVTLKQALQAMLVMMSVGMSFQYFCSTCRDSQMGLGLHA